MGGLGARVSTLTRFFTQSHVGFLPKLLKSNEPTTITSNNQKRDDDETDSWSSLATLKCVGTCTYSQETPSRLRKLWNSTIWRHIPSSIDLLWISVGEMWIWVGRHSLPARSAELLSKLGDPTPVATKLCSNDKLSNCRSSLPRGNFTNVSAQQHRVRRS